MITSPQAAIYRPAKDIFTLPGIGVEVEPADFPRTILRFRNDRAAAQVGLDHLDDKAWAQHFGRFAPLPDTLEKPLALKYHGHQFRSYNPDIGDGRGFLFAQLRDTQDRLMDLGTKGSGQTPYSRFGDGRLTLKGAVREILATEMLEALGVPTSRTFSVIETGEELVRNDEPSPTRSAVLVRLNHGHIRIGSFQRAATQDDKPLLEELVRYSLERLYGEIPQEEAAPQLLGRVVERTADMAASFMVAGFVHGVLNSDNINVTGESFDYGPWRFSPKWDPTFTAAYFDHSGLYAFGRQAEAIHWDVAQLAISLRSICPSEPLIAQLDRFPDLYAAALAKRFLWRLGVDDLGMEGNRALMEEAVRAMIATDTVMDQFYFDWRGGALRNDAAKGRYSDAAWDKVRELMAETRPTAALDHGYWAVPAPQSMHIDEVEEIWSAIAQRDDWSLLNDKVAALRNMGQALGAPPVRE